MPLDLPHTLLRRFLVPLGIAACLMLWWPSPAQAFDACSLLPPGPLRDVCQTGSGAAGVLSMAADPFGYIAQALAVAMSTVQSWIIQGINNLTLVDFTISPFTQTYAMLLGLSESVLVLAWLVAVGLRAFRSVSLGQALGEMIGYLFLAMAFAALAPSIMILLNEMTDLLTQGLTLGMSNNADDFLQGIATAAVEMGPTGPGALLPALVFFLSIIAGFLILTELVIRAGFLLIGALIAAPVAISLVDRAMWRHWKRWWAFMLATFAVKPMLVLVLGLATLLMGNGIGDGLAPILFGTLLMFLAVFASYLLYKLVPGIGDSIVDLHSARRSMSNVGPAAMVSPSSMMQQGIRTHMVSSRGAGGAAGAAGKAGAAGAAGAAGMAAGAVSHVSRTASSKAGQQSASTSSAPTATKTVHRTTPPREKGTNA